MYKFKAYINNLIDSNDNVLEIKNPTTSEIAGTVPALQQQQIDLAFSSARLAQKHWEKIGLEERIVILKRWKELINKNKQLLAKIITTEIAKPLNEALAEVERSIEYFDLSFKEVYNLNQLIIDGKNYGYPKKIATFSRVAKGVSVCISPFNFPINLALSKIVPNLITGNTVVFKPATQGSLTGAFLGELALEAKLPAGVLNVVTGRGREIGDKIITNPEIDFISFTGSVDVGKHLLEIASSKDVVLELGGKDAALVLDAENLEKYSEEIILGAFGYSGQRCTAIKRVITTNEVADQLIPLLIDKINKLSIGNPFENKQITPLIDAPSADFVFNLIQDAKNKGAKILTGGERENNLIYPTLVDNVISDMELYWKEPFGPVLPIIRVENVEQMIEVNNASEFGLQASIFSKNLQKALEIAPQLEVGTININGKSQRGPDIFPFLGIKNSGFGVQGIRDTLLFSTRYKGIVINN